MTLTITVKGPLLTKATAPVGYGVDAPFHRDGQGRYTIPGSLLKGRLRDGLCELHKLAQMAVPNPEEWFGKREKSETARFSTRFHFSDAVCQTDGAGGERVRVQIDDERQAASEKMLQVMEHPFPAGTEATFAAELTVDGLQEDVATVKRLVEKALLFTGSLGAYTTVGFGEISSVCVTDRKVDTVAAPKVTADRVRIRLTTEDLLCVTSKSNTAGNLFESTATIPGGVLKGAVASQWLRLLGTGERFVRAESDPTRKELAEEFHLVRFSHAMPSESETEIPAVCPLSMDDEGEDHALLASPPTGLGRVPNFQPDWKEANPEKVPARFRQPKIVKELRVRTAIESDNRRAEDGKLFAQELVRPEGLFWHATIDFGKIEDATKREKVREQLSGLIGNGIAGVGKTKARMKVAFLGADRVWQEGKGGKVVVTLQTAALLTNPAELIGKRDAASLKDAYRKYFTERSNGQLTLSHLFARQELQGGEYLYKQFQLGREDGRYAPYLLTLAGSVFVLEGTEAAKGTLEEWVRYGLPVPQWAVDGFKRNGKAGDDWSNHPFHPANGFGQITVNFAGGANA